MKYILLLALVCGCVSRAELAATRETMDQGTRTIREQHKKMIHGQLDPRTLSPATVQALDVAHREYEATVAESRSRYPVLAAPATQPETK